MSFSIFDETYYQESYPDVDAAVRSGTFTSGLQHFQQFGLAEGRTEVSRFWSESGYFSPGPVFAPPKNFDVLEAIRNGIFPSGLAHFIQVGEAEGRFPEFSLYNEDYYLSRYPDIDSAVAAGTLPSGYSHFIQFGQQENRVANPFNEAYYLALYPDVAAAVNAGIFNSALEHYSAFGRNEGRKALISGTSDSDRIEATDLGAIGSGYAFDIAGVSVDIITGEPPEFVPTSFGIGESDRLNGSNGVDTFILGVGRSASNPNPQKFYVGQGDADFAEVGYFDIIEGDIIGPGTDRIQLAGRPEEYVFEDDRIFAITNFADVVSGAAIAPNLDLVATGFAGNLQVTSVDPVTETFIVQSTF